MFAAVLPGRQLFPPNGPDFAGMRRQDAEGLTEGPLNLFEGYCDVSYFASIFSDDIGVQSRFSASPISCRTPRNTSGRDSHMYGFRTIRFAYESASFIPPNLARRVKYS